MNTKIIKHILKDLEVKGHDVYNLTTGGSEKTCTKYTRINIGRKNTKHIEKWRNIGMGKLMQIINR